jgi:PPOX class probable F420-dependent enzyme
MVLVMRRSGGWARERFAAARVARLATSDARGRPHVVPIVLALDGDRIVTAVDRKPKSGAPLRRLANIAANPQVSALIDGYDEDWSQLWWARADGAARIVEAGAVEAAEALDRLVRRYDQYATALPPGPVILIAVERWTGWSAGAD